MSETFEIDRTGEPMTVKRLGVKGFELHFDAKTAAPFHAIQEDNENESTYVLVAQILLNQDGTASMRGKFYDGAKARAIYEGFEKAATTENGK